MNLRVTAAVLAIAATLAIGRIARAVEPSSPPFGLAREDTFPLAEAWSDTVFVEEPRVSIEEIVRRIGERMAADEERHGDRAWTQVTRAVARPHDGEEGERNRTEYETVERIRIGRDGSVQRVQVRSVERTFKDGALDKEKTDDEIEADWGEITDSATALPFSLESDAYNYEIAGRHLLGEHLVYEVRFAPRSRFAALPSGTVWLDWSDFVIRRFEAQYRDAVPMPLFLRAIPWFRLRRTQCGDTWFVQDLMARIELQDVWPGIPSSVEIHTRFLGYTIDGVPCAGDEGGP
jgi:hypothetical protein